MSRILSHLAHVELLTLKLEDSVSFLLTRSGLSKPSALTSLCISAAGANTTTTASCSPRRGSPGLATRLGARTAPMNSNRQRRGSRRVAFAASGERNQSDMDALIDFAAQVAISTKSSGTSIASMPPRI